MQVHKPPWIRGKLQPKNTHKQITGVHSTTSVAKNTASAKRKFESSRAEINKYATSELPFASVSNESTYETIEIKMTLIRMKMDVKVEHIFI